MSRKDANTKENSDRRDNKLSRTPSPRNTTTEKPFKKVNKEEQYEVGETLRSSKDAMKRDKDLVSKLKVDDGAFVKRTDGSYTYAIINDRYYDDQGEVFSFVVNKSGSTKTFPERMWAKFIKCPAKELIDRDESPVPKQQQQVVAGGYEQSPTSVREDVSARIKLRSSIADSAASSHDSGHVYWA